MLTLLLFLTIGMLLFLGIAILGMLFSLIYFGVDLLEVMKQGVVKGEQGYEFLIRIKPLIFEKMVERTHLTCIRGLRIIEKAHASGFSDEDTESLEKLLKDCKGKTIRDNSGGGTLDLKVITDAAFISKKVALNDTQKQALLREMRKFRSEWNRFCLVAKVTSWSPIFWNYG